MARREFDVAVTSIEAGKRRASVDTQCTCSEFRSDWTCLLLAWSEKRGEDTFVRSRKRTDDVDEDQQLPGWLRPIV